MLTKKKKQNKKNNNLSKICCFSQEKTLSYLFRPFCFEYRTQNNADLHNGTHQSLYAFDTPALLCLDKRLHLLLQSVVPSGSVRARRAGHYFGPQGPVTVPDLRPPPPTLFPLFTPLSLSLYLSSSPFLPHFTFLLTLFVLAQSNCSYIFPNDCFQFFRCSVETLVPFE